MPGQNHSRLVVSGEMRNATNARLEIWSYSVALSSDDGAGGIGGAYVDPAQFPAIAAATRAFHSRQGTRIAQYCTLTSIKLNDFSGVDGRQVNGETREDVTAAAGGEVGPGSFPHQVACAVSLRTGLRGASRRGRFYLPPLAGGADFLTEPYTRRLKSGIADLICQSVVQWFQELIAADARPVVASSVVGLTPITEVEVGDVLDTIRRRRNDYLEVRTVRPLAP